MLIVLDIDGVLNAHVAHENGYCGIDKSCAVQFDRILRAFPEADICLSSAWRYQILNRDMTPLGFVNLLLTHGVNCHGRALSYCESDEVTAHWHFAVPRTDGPEWFKWISQNGIAVRNKQINKEIARRHIKDFVVLDDLELDVPNFVRTDGKVGLTETDADKAIKILSAT